MEHPYYAAQGINDVKEKDSYALSTSAAPSAAKKSHKKQKV